MVRGDGSGVTNIIDRFGDEMLIPGVEDEEKAEKRVSGSGRVT